MLLPDQSAGGTVLHALRISPAEIALQELLLEDLESSGNGAGFNTFPAENALLRVEGGPAVFQAHGPGGTGLHAPGVVAETAGLDPVPVFQAVDTDPGPPGVDHSIVMQGADQLADPAADTFSGIDLS